jgi:hypothetical protein
MMHLNVLLLATLCGLLTGCHKSGVSFAELRSVPTVTVANNLVTVHFKGVYIGSETWAQIKSRMEGQTLCVSGYKTSSEPEQDHDYAIKVPAGAGGQPVNVVWVNPDGSRVPLAVTN